jgi:DNA polymerase-3 subunit epsilon
MPIRRLPADRPRTRVISATSTDLDAHAARMAAIEKSCGRTPLWLAGADAE